VLLLTGCKEPDHGAYVEQLESLLESKNPKQKHLPHLLPMLQLDRFSIGGNSVEIASLQLDYTGVSPTKLSLRWHSSPKPDDRNDSSREISNDT
jgi:hypothetical protein